MLVQGGVWGIRAWCPAHHGPKGARWTILRAQSGHGSPSEGPRAPAERSSGSSDGMGRSQGRAPNRCAYAERSCGWCTTRSNVVRTHLGRRGTSAGAVGGSSATAAACCTRAGAVGGRLGDGIHSAQRDGPRPQPTAAYAERMVRPGSCVRPAGVSPVPVGTGAPGSRLRFVIERLRAERSVESPFGGSNRAGRSVSERCSLVRVTTGEPSRSCHGEGHVLQALFRGQPVRSPRGRDGGTYGGSGTEQERPVCARLVGQETGRISRW